MTFKIQLGTLGRFSVRLVLGLCFFAPPAHAASVIATSDLNGDGVADRVILPTSAQNAIVVRVSGSKPEVLELADTVFSVVTADVDQDGDLDLAALEEHKGLVVWLNDGKGQFEAATKTPESQRVMLSGGPLAKSRDYADCRVIAHFSRGGSTRLAHVRRVNTFLPPPNVRSALPPSTTVIPVDTTDFAVSRAPPVAAS